ncbi:MAG: asparagine synthase (glutamine-hydrolyzing) [Patescibacteria group bacterium]|nr:asparagine synthase (glutamine-hydrolyzing) [Patescibacteria group bacterium]MDD5164183.1 asparagine synthase (glutamine-hydrolyzing) [Patescibacteria group bacterium]MDD5534483.1 asparagine synthase (glutamine-hydrolyzing) [Patescibacteria group bacterium]
MCGIVGTVNLDQKLVDKKDIEKMVKIIKHRGPDDEGYFIDKNVGLGHCRLSIIDLSMAGHQPMTNENETLWIVFNGEIYNYLELRKELEKCGHIFVSNTDTEVILHAYKEWSEKCLEKFNGMWAFAIWDKNKKELFCSRDRFGIKPFYYFFDGKIFTFASEIKALLELGIPQKPTDALIYDFLKFGMLDHTNETFFKNIYKLPASSWLKLTSDGKIIIEKYWDFEVSDKIEDKVPDQKYTEQFRELFIDTIKLRLRSDVPIGSCLSGGLDSSSIVCTVNKLLKEKNVPSIGEIQKTFSSCFENKKFDEREYIEEVIKHTGAEKNYIFPKPEEFLKELDNLIWHQEEPFSGTSMFAQRMVFKKAREKVKILLDGQGGDELLAGYRKFYFFYLLKLFRNKKFIKCLETALPFFTSIEILKTLYIKSGLKYLFKISKNDSIDNLLNPVFSKNFTDRKLKFGYQNNLGKRLKEDLTKWSLPVLLRYEDKNSGTFGLEARLPFLDYRLVEQAAKMPLDQKMRLGWTKFILREAMKNILPEKIRLRKSKLGFVTPEEMWYKKYLTEDIELKFKNPLFIADYVNTEKLLDSFQKYKMGQRFFYNKTIFLRFYILELWGRKFIYNYQK